MGREIDRKWLRSDSILGGPGRVPEPKTARQPPMFQRLGPYGGPFGTPWGAKGRFGADSGSF